MFAAILILCQCNTMNGIGFYLLVSTIGMEKTNMLYENDTFMVLEIFSDIATVNEFNEYIEGDYPEHWIKVLTDAGVIGWFKYSCAYYKEEDVVEELKLC